MQLHAFVVVEERSVEQKNVPWEQNYVWWGPVLLGDMIFEGRCDTPQFKSINSTLNRPNRIGWLIRRVELKAKAGKNSVGTDPDMFG